jgi:hypothetical protein
MRPIADVETDIMRWFRFGSRPSPLSSALAGTLFLVSLAASAQDEMPVEPVRFLIETITVESTREAAAHIIEAETLLEEGESYTEDDLREAIARVQRLPFVLQASFSLRKGSERGAYELVVQAHTARWFFFDRSVHLARFNQLYSLDDFGAADSLTGSHAGLIGGRIFVGPSGVLYGSVGFQRDLASDASGPQIGYTQYNLFGAGIVADLSYASHGCCSTQVLPFGVDPNLSSWDWRDDEQASLSLAVPLSWNRSFQVGWSERSGQAAERRKVLVAPFLSDQVDFVFDGKQDSRRMEARWIQDTSDDPLLPSRGTVFSVGLEYDQYEARDLRALRSVRDSSGALVTQGEVDLPSFEGEQLLATAAATRHWSVTPRQSVSAGGQLSYGQSRLTNLEIGGVFLPRTELDVYGGSVSGRHLYRFWSLREPDNMGDLYLDSRLTYGFEATSSDLGLESNPLHRLELTTALIFRNQWGRLRLAFTYLDLGAVQK